MILSRSRTGSNLLVSYLNSHPHIYAEGEIFGRLDGRSIDVVLRRAVGPQAWHIQAKGFKVFYYHPIDDDSGTLWERLEQVSGLRVIHLVRRNLLRVLVSRKLAERKDLWIRRDDVPLATTQTNRLTLDPADAQREFEQTRAWERQWEKGIGSHPVLKIAYEDLVADPLTEFHRITDFLSVAPCSPSTRLRRQNPQPLERTVVNYDELKEYFADSEWSEFFGIGT